jgi:hypothetical protein
MELVATYIPVVTLVAMLGALTMREGESTSIPNHKLDELPN